MQVKRQSSGIIAGILLPMGLICLFAGCSLFLALLGGNAYKDIQAGVDDSMGSTVAASYLRTKLGQSAGAGGVFLRDEGGIQVLVITEEVDGRAYETLIYSTTAQTGDGQSQTQFSERYQSAGTPFEAAGGVLIAQITSCTFTLEADGLFTAEIVSAGGIPIRTVYRIPQGGAL